MQRSLTTLFLTTLISTPIYAAQWYVGLDTGVDTSIFKQNAHITQTENNIIDKERYAGKGYLGGLLVGLSTRYERYYLAAELKGTISTLEFNSANLEFFHQNYSRTSYRINHHYGLSVIPGLILEDRTTLLYALLGIENGKFKTNTSDESLQSINKNVSGVRYGIGIEKAIIWPSTSVRFEYSNITYNKVNMRTVTAVNKHTWIRTETNQFELAFIYRFNTPGIAT